jgi:hypothetical protein
VYLINLSNSCPPRNLAHRVKTVDKNDNEREGLGKTRWGLPQRPPMPAVKRLHILYILHDSLLFTRMHATTPSQQILNARQESLITLLAEAAVCGCGSITAPICQQVLNLISLWKKSNLFDPVQLDQMQQSVLEAAKLDWESVVEKLAESKSAARPEDEGDIMDDTAWIIPQHHGPVKGKSARYSHQPATNGLYTKRSRGCPLRSYALPPSAYPFHNRGTSMLLKRV